MCKFLLQVHIFPTFKQVQNKRVLYTVFVAYIILIEQKVFSTHFSFDFSNVGFSGRPTEDFFLEQLNFSTLINTYFSDMLQYSDVLRKLFVFFLIVIHNFVTFCDFIYDLLILSSALTLWSFGNAFSKALMEDIDLKNKKAFKRNIGYAPCQPFAANSKRDKPNICTNEVLLDWNIIRQRFHTICGISQMFNVIFGPIIFFFLAVCVLFYAASFQAVISGFDILLVCSFLIATTSLIMFADFQKKVTI